MNRGTHNGRYRVDDEGRAIAEPDLMTWANWMEDFQNRVVQLTHFGPIRVSTVFLGLDHNFGWKGPPVLWETMVFGGPLNYEQRRYCSLGDAILGHEALCIDVLIAGPSAPERSLMGGT